LPLAASAATLLMIALAALTHHTMTERNELALDGRLLGLAHSAETRFRDSGIDGADALLSDLLTEGDPELAGLTLRDGAGELLATVGEIDSTGRVRTVNLFLGRHAGAGPRPRWQGADPAGPRGGGRGRFELGMHLDPAAGTLPLAARLLLPTVIATGLALVWFADLAGRLLDRQRRELREVSERRRLEALARAGAGLAHQLRTPLATIKGTSQLMSEFCDDDELRPRIEIVISQTDRMNRLLGRLLDYARPPAPEPQTVTIREAAEVVAARYPGVELEIEEGAAAWVDPEHLEEILDNLLANAVFFSPEGAAVVMDSAADGDDLRLAIRDRGPGPGDDPELHFEAYQTTRADGTGLGLPIARALVEANRGSLILTTSAGGGCEAVVTLPRVAGRS
jgi:anti-sigma regulatory factor (Ser/Thr protein kinase)